MNWWVPKIGALFFDALHAYGLAILLAAATGQPVLIQDEGTGYRLSCPLSEVPPTTPDLLDTVLQLPIIDELKNRQPDLATIPLAIATLDGLLAALFTQSGVRLASVGDLTQKQHSTPSVQEEALKKAQQATMQWKTWTERASQGTSSWLGTLLQGYQPKNTALPVLRIAKNQKDLSIWMTLDPALGLSTRRPWSDGLISAKTNVTLDGLRYGVLLARIGATRFLRAQPVAVHLINYYLPLASTLTVYPESALSLLPCIPLSSGQALLIHWLSFVRRTSPLAATWHALAYQTLETQGTKQAIAMQWGCLPFDWITAITERVGYSLIRGWRWCLLHRSEFTPYPLDGIVTCLKTRQEADWIAHLHDLVWVVQVNASETIRSYSLVECKELTMAMTSPGTSPLSSILERKKGTLRFGHALRQLGQANHAHLMDTLDDLESVSSLEQLIQVLQRAVQACDLASAKSPFIVIPDEKDLTYLLDDVAQHGVRVVASLLLILSALRYPSVETPEAGSTRKP